MNKLKFASKKQRAVLYMFLFILFFVSRILFLDEDLPPWGVINYQPVDEGTYSMLALNKYNYGEISPEVLDGNVEYITSPHVRANIFGNVLVYIGLKIFGDNYWGLRIGSVLSGLLILILSITMMNHITKKSCMNQQKQKLVNIGFLTYFVLDFNFTMASRVMETSIHRLLFVLLIIFAYMKIQKNMFAKFFVMSLLATFSVFGVYITNVFVYLAIFITLIGYGIKYGRSILAKGFLGMICGFFIMLIPLEFYYVKVWQTYAIKNMLSAILSFSSQEGYTVTSSWWVLIRSTVHFISSNVNLYSITLLGVFILSIPFLLHLVIKVKNLNVLFLLALIFSLYIQTLVSEDYIVRKFIVIYPVFIFLLSILIANNRDLKEYIVDKLVCVNGKRNKVLLITYVMFTVIVCICVFLLRFFIISNDTQNDFSKIDIYFLIIVSTISLILLVICFICFTSGKKVTSLVLGLTILCASSIHIYLNLNYIFLNRTYTEKQAMIDIGTAAGNNYVIGSFFPMGYTLYNDIKPIITSTENMVKALEEYPDLLCLDYTDEGELGVRGYLNTLFVNSSYDLVKQKEYQRNFSTFGVCRNVALYKSKFNKNK